MLTAAFIAAGCKGSAGHRQAWDTEPFPEPQGDIVFRRSLPHGGEWPDLHEIADRLQESGYEVVPLFAYRKTDYLVAHQLRMDREHEGEVVAPYASDRADVKSQFKLALAMAYGLSSYLTQPLILVPYEPFVSVAIVRDMLFDSLGLRCPDGMDFYNANERERYLEVKALKW